MVMILSTAVHHMEQKQLRNTIIALLVFFSLSKSLLPVQLMIDNKGYDGIWFICVYLVSAYIRLYGIPCLEKRSIRGWFCYGAGVLSILLVTFLVRAVYLKTGSLDHFVGSAFHYNHWLYFDRNCFAYYYVLQKLLFISVLDAYTWTWIWDWEYCSNEKRNEIQCN